VPFHIRAGKALATTALEVVVELHAPPRLLFSPDDCQPHSNLLRFRLGHHDGVTLSVQANQPGQRLVSHQPGPVHRYPRGSWGHRKPRPWWPATRDGTTHATMRRGGFQ
jgi:glucose-6-phosphate 1-dehydrogenase